MREPKPVTRVEVSEKNKTLRVIAAILLLVIGALGITSGIMNLLNKDAGWQTVQGYSGQRSCSENFILQYHFSESGAEATALNRKLESLYGEACVKAYQLFTPDESIEGVNNVYYVNQHPNEIITVDPVLYAAFAKLADTPYLYLGPAYAHYSSMIYNTDESYLQDLDPAQSDDAKAYVEKIAEFANNRSYVNLEILDENQIKLYVSPEYLDFAKAEEIDTFIDFGYMTNAVIIDYLADTLIAENLTQGYLVSADGYTRNLDSKYQFSFNIFDRVGNLINLAAVMDYNGPISIVFLKDYPGAPSDANYRESGDHYVHLFADPVDGMYRTSTENLVSYSYDMGCTDVLLQMLPSFVGSRFTVPEGVFSVWCDDYNVCYNDESVSFKAFMKTDEMTYQGVLTK